MLVHKHAIASLESLIAAETTLMSLKGLVMERQLAATHQLIALIALALAEMEKKILMICQIHN